MPLDELNEGGAIETEVRKCQGKGAAPRHDLRASTRDEVERGEVLEDPDRIVGAQHAHRARVPDLRGAGRRLRADSGRRRDHEVWALIFPGAERVDAHPADWLVSFD